MVEALRDIRVLELCPRWRLVRLRQDARFRIRRGQRWYGAGLDLGIVAAARHAFPIYEAIRAEADNPPVDGPAFYRPLTGLRLRGTRFVAGFAHEDEDLATRRRIRQQIEDALEHRVDISTSCGLGRRDASAAVAAMDRIQVLLDD